MTCTRCACSGFLNLDQVDAETLGCFEETGDHQIILDWIAANSAHDVQVCDCCGDSETWYGKPGQHNLNHEPHPGCY
jgi:hypothetical protein